MQGDFYHIQELSLDPHVWKVQVDPHRDVVGPMALLRSVEEPRGSSDWKDPKGALLRDVEETVALLRSVEEPRGSSDLKDPN